MYWLEFRHNIGFDVLPPDATDGVLVHVADTDNSEDEGTSLLDARPGGPPSVYTATLRAGESWTTPEGVTIAVTAVQASGADVSVTADAELPGGSFTGVDPARLLDTRTGGGTPLGAGEVLSTYIDVNVPAIPPPYEVGGPVAVVANLTAVQPTTGGYLTAWPAGRARPVTSDVNFGPGQIVPNALLTGLDYGELSVYNAAGRTDVLLDISGYFTEGLFADAPAAVTG